MILPPCLVGRERLPWLGGVTPHPGELDPYAAQASEHPSSPQAESVPQLLAHVLELDPYAAQA